MILPRLLIHFADFPYRHSPPCRATHPRALMRFGTTSARPFHRAAHVARRATLPTFSPESCLRRVAAVAIRVTTWRAVPRVSAWFPFIRRRITSFLGRTRLCMFLKMLLLPRSAPAAPPAVLAHALPRHARARLPRIASGASCRRSAPSIFGAPRFGGYVVTRFLADADLHGHRPTVPIAPAPSLSVLPLATYPPRRFIPPCSPCLPRAAHWRASDTQGAPKPPHRRVRSLLAAPTSSLPQPPVCAPLSCETFRREPATRQFVWSFAPMPMSYHRVEHQNGSDPPPVFPLASISTGIVHCLSGPTAATYRLLTAKNISFFASPPRKSPWSVLQYGS